jgi:hypothetical protein
VAPPWGSKPWCHRARFDFGEGSFAGPYNAALAPSRPTVGCYSVTVVRGPARAVGPTDSARLKRGMCMDQDDLPVAVFSGLHSDGVFLVSLLGSEGIEASCEKDFMAIDITGAHRLMVRRRDAPKAARLVEGFRRNRGPTV